ncbi:hypothetical protein TYRP_005525 [Tyrophagus putrescentiae]|nr:hypothetical protein TYRP_005525 [Tyrophagus putrescentiae]
MQNKEVIISSSSSSQIRIVPSELSLKSGNESEKSDSGLFQFSPEFTFGGGTRAAEKKFPSYDDTDFAVVIGTLAEPFENDLNLSPETKD